MHSFSRRLWYSWKCQSSAIMACTRSSIHSICRTIEWNHRLGGAHWAVIRDIHCCCHANHNRRHSRCTWKQKPNVTNGWKPSKEPCKWDLKFISFPSYSFVRATYNGLIDFYDFLSNTGTIWSRSVAEIPTINFNWQHSIRWQCVDIVRNSWRVSFIRATNVKCARCRCTRGVYRQRGAVNKRPLALHRPFVIVNCPNFIGSLDRCCAKRPRQS